ncbi:partner of Y14 and mago [Anthonomus grandis grandis]|uniref:partner of Y14 and mago n=1 Tax=Anthonomus grandis grandis TaxID=2921223 RepID=UPI002165A8FA|nr:partner of Y14 and mago [Anthonomus grandis grandis]
MSTYAANIVTENGEQFIPASQRPDGTWRKARRVKEGYVPQEEVPLYESKGKQFMAKKQEPVVLPTGQVAQRPIPGLFIVQEEKDKKGQKKKIKNKVEEINKILESTKISEGGTKTAPATAQANQEATDPAKKLKNLKKRLREVESLEEKVKSGALAKPEPEQLAKIKRKNDLLMQIAELEKQVQ